MEETSVWCRKFDTLESRSEISEKFKNHVSNEKVLHRVKEERNILYKIKRRKANWIGHILPRNCFLKHFVEEKV